MIISRTSGEIKAYRESLSENISRLFIGVKHSVRMFFEFLKRVYDYTPLLWSDRDWDYHFILKMLKFKLARVRKKIVKNNFIVQEEIDLIVKQITECETLLDRIMDDSYMWDDSEYAEYKEKWGETKFQEDKGWGCLYGTKVNSSEDYEESGLEFRAIVKRAERARNKDLDDLFKNIRTNLESWWD